MLNSQTILESCLHENLTERESPRLLELIVCPDINSEIGLNTIISLKSAQDWMKRSVMRPIWSARRYIIALSSSSGSNKTPGITHLLLERNPSKSHGKNGSIITWKQVVLNCYDACPNGLRSKHWRI